MRDAHAARAPEILTFARGRVHKAGDPGGRGGSPAGGSAKGEDGPGVASVLRDACGGGAGENEAQSIRETVVKKEKHERRGMKSLDECY